MIIVELHGPVSYVLTSTTGTTIKTPFRIGSPPACPNAEAEPIVPPRDGPAAFLR